MASTKGPDETGKTGPGPGENPELSDHDLERRRHELEASLAARRRTASLGGDARTSGATGYGQAIKLSSEFIAGVAVGAGLGWIVDRFAGTSPFGLIVFLLLGFGAGVLNVMRSAGVVAQAGIKTPGKGAEVAKDERPGKE
jgi:ATP synthase protein I